MESFEFLEDRYFENTIRDYLLAIGGVLIGLTIIRLFRNLILSRLKKKITSDNDLIIHGIEKFLLPVATFSLFYFAANYLTLSEKATRVVHYAAVVVMTYFVVRIVSRTIAFSIKSYVRKEKGEEKIKQTRGIVVVVNVIVWVLGFIFLFDNLGYNVTAIITGLGIGGIAIALAAQNILGDIFNYFVIFFDRPFEIGDLVKVDDKSGTVEYIGVKTTRLKSVNGEQLIFSNSDLTKSRLHNYQRMQARRMLFTLHILYSTPYEKAEMIPDKIKKIIEAEPLAIFERVHLATLGEYSMNFEVVYHVKSVEYQDYMDVNHKINFGILKELSALDISLAYPTQSLILNNRNS